MKRLSILFVLIFSFTMIFADNLTREQLKLRSDIMNFLSSEGFQPSISSSGNINFKREGNSYIIAINSRDENPMYVSIIRSFNIPESATRDELYAACAIMNKYKCSKMVLFETALEAHVEMYVRDASYFKSVFYENMKQVDAVKNNYDECLSEARSYFNNGSSNGGGTTSSTTSSSSYASDNSSSSDWPRRLTLGLATLNETTFNQLINQGVAMDDVCRSDFYEGMCYYNFESSTNSAVVNDITLFQVKDARIPYFITRHGISWSSSRDFIQSKARAAGWTLVKSTDSAIYYRNNTAYSVQFHFMEGRMNYISFEMNI